MRFCDFKFLCLAVVGVCVCHSLIDAFPVDGDHPSIVVERRSSHRNSALHHSRVNLGKRSSSASLVARPGHEIEDSDENNSDSEVGDSDENEFEDESLEFGPGDLAAVKRAVYDRMPRVNGLRQYRMPVYAYRSAFGAKAKRIVNPREP